MNEFRKRCDLCGLQRFSYAQNVPLQTAAKDIYEVKFGSKLPNLPLLTQQVRQE